MLNRNLIGKTYEPVIFRVTDQRLKFFAKATGQTDPIYYDHDIAISQGHKGIVCPPTFLIVVGMEQKNPFQFLEDLDVKIERMLHAGQEFIYEELVYEGDKLRMDTKIIDMYDKKEGLLQFCNLESKFTNQNNKHIATLKNTIVAR
ncbi:MAG: acyl dehydratase [Candidatus Marinimicrobia bacterium]|nr:acyl dehydratase [Candidatus Neomarinimicrobiota bacterium]